MAAFSVELSNQRVEMVEGVDAYQQEGPLTTFFAVRLVASWIYWNDPAHRDVEIAPWMTPRYVAHSWRLPPEVVAETLDLDPPAGPPPVRGSASMLRHRLRSPIPLATSSTLSGGSMAWPRTLMS